MSLTLRRLLPRRIAAINPKPTPQIRQLTTSPTNHTSWSPSPSPPKLPKSEQEIYENLLKKSTGAFSTPSPPSSQPKVIPQIKINQSPNNASAVVNPKDDATTPAKVVRKGEELHPNIRRGAAPEFEGDVNPKTGEVGGPKNEPLRWGHTGDWSYNGRATDF